MPQTANIERVLRQQAVIKELAHLIGEFTDLASFFDAVVCQVGRATQVDHVKILRYRPELGDLLVIAGIGWDEGVVGHATFSVDLDSPPGSAFQTGVSTLIPDLPHSTEFRFSGVLREHKIVSVLNVPIEMDGAAWGVLEVDSATRCDFADDTQGFLEIVASLLSSAIRRHDARVSYQAALAQTAIAANRQKTLMQEMQHRMKNNYQLILSMIQLARNQATAPTKQVLQKLADSIIAMSLANDQLTLDAGTGSVRLASYLRTLAMRIQEPFEGLALQVHAEDFDVGVDDAISLGLIVNELVTNALKHAFPKKSGGELHVQLARGPGRGELQLSVSDTGKGFGAGARPGSGLKLVDTLARQMRGRVERQSSEKGSTTRVVFPTSAVKAQT
jgi:two-component sensor histidine kinase